MTASSHNSDVKTNQTLYYARCLVASDNFSFQMYGTKKCTSLKTMGFLD